MAPPGVALVPGPIEVLGGEAELDNEVAGQVLRADLAALLLPQAEQGLLVLPHDDAGIGSADEGAPVGQFRQLRCGRTDLWYYDFQPESSPLDPLTWVRAEGVSRPSVRPVICNAIYP